MTMTYSPTPLSGLPDPELQAEFYADVPIKRLFAWIVDTAIVALMTAIAVPLTLGLGLFVLPLLFVVIGFLYRWISISNRSATPGMRLASIELRAGDGHPFDTTLAGLHTAGYYVSTAIFPLQLISIVLMLTGARRQGLTDLVLGTAAVNRAARS
jgi:uncharacterized RDD family membrane protein YckC